MLSLDMLNKRVNQHPKKDGNEKPQLPPSPRVNAAEGSPTEAREEKLLEQSLPQSLPERLSQSLPERLSMFLQNRDGDGDSASWGIDSYDNSPERLETGITFHYQIFFPKLVAEELRGRNKYVLVGPILDQVGDSYTYVMPIWLDENALGEPYYKSDYGERVDQTVPKGLLWALTQLQRAVSTGDLFVPRKAQGILEENGFLEDGKINLSISGVLVEKYLKELGSSEKEAIEYLTEMLARDEDMARSMLGDATVPEPVEGEVEPPETALEPPETALEVSVPALSTDKKTLKNILREKNITVYQYKQLPRSPLRRLRESTTIYVPLLGEDEGRFARVMFRTGMRDLKVGEAERLIQQYNRAVLEALSSGEMKPVAMGEELQRLMRYKGFYSLITNAKPKDAVPGFTIVREMK